MKDETLTPPDDNLDELLRMWASQQQPTAEQMNTLCKLVQSSLSESNEPAHCEQLALPQKKIKNKRLSLFSSVAVASVSLSAGVLLCLLVWSQSDKIVDSTPAISNSLDTNTFFDKPDFATQKSLVKKLQSFYSDSLLWIAETSDDLMVELSEGTLENDSVQPWLIIRLAVESSGQTATIRQPLWQVDLAVRSEQSVELTDRANSQSQINFWPYLTQDGLVMLDTKFTSLGPVKSPGNSTSLVRPGTRTRLNNPDDPYIIWQYVEFVQMQ